MKVETQVLDGTFNNKLPITCVGEKVSAKLSFTRTVEQHNPNKFFVNSFFVTPPRRPFLIFHEPREGSTYCFDTPYFSNFNTTKRNKQKDHSWITLLLT